MTWIYVGFVAFILVMLVIDLKVVNRRAHEIRPRESLIFTGITVVLAVAFAGCIYLMYQNDWPAGITDTLKASLRRDGPQAEAQIGPLGFGFEAATTYLTAWVLEYALSVDNLFVIAVIFGYFKVPAKFQHRVLFWGVLGALVMRGAMIAAGTKAVQQFEWLEYVFGAFLVYTAYKMLRAGDGHHDPSQSLPVRAARRILPLTPDLHGEKFLVRIDGKRYMTPLFLVLLTVEFTDVVFAVDSIPAAIGLTSDPFLVFTSNIFAILGLRSLYFAVAAALGSFRYLKVSLVFVLAFIGFKMLTRPWVEVSPLMSLAVVLGLLLAGGVASVFASKKERARKRPPIEDLAEALEVSRRNFRRALILIVGFTVIAFGLAIGFLPGPGPVIIVPIGLAILATEFAWARRVQRKLQEQARRLSNVAEQVASKSSPWAVPPVALFLGAGVIFLAHNGPFAPRHVYLASIGLWILVLYWAWKTVLVSRRAARQQPSGHPHTPAAQTHADDATHRLSAAGGDPVINSPPAA